LKLRYSAGVLAGVLTVVGLTFGQTQLDLKTQIWDRLKKLQNKGALMEVSQSTIESLLNEHEVMSAVQDVLSSVRISDVYRATCGSEPRRSGRDTWRARATWRRGDGFSVAIDDSQNVWHDFVNGDGGGVLALIQTARRCSKADALRWLADFAGVPLDDKAPDPAARARWARERCELERDLPGARYWRRAALVLLENVLDAEKAKLFDPTAGPADTDLIRNYTRMIERLRTAGDTMLVAEYHEWRADNPRHCAGLVRWARERERADVGILAQYLMETYE
jgi:hypothetical protein